MNLKKPSKGFLFIALPLLFLVFIGFIYISLSAPFTVAGISMEPNFRDGQKILGLKLFGQLKRGDVVIYTSPDNTSYIARVIGLPGEKLEMKNYYVFINDQQIEEPYLAPDAHTFFSEKMGGVFQLNDDEYFVMSDNRPYGDDSRLVGPITRSKIKAKIIF